jgi:hypothetical protein
VSVIRLALTVDLMLLGIVIPLWSSGLAGLYQEVIPAIVSAAHIHD